VSSPVSSDYASGASGLAGSLSRPGEVSAISGLTPSSLVPPLCSPELLRQGLGSLAPDLVSGESSPGLENRLWVSFS